MSTDHAERERNDETRIIRDIEEKYREREEENDSNVREEFSDQTDMRLLTGGEEGADTLFASCAWYCGHRVVNFSFLGHDFKTRNGVIYVCSDRQLSQANKSLRNAARFLRREVSRDPFFGRLLRRNYWEIRGTEALYVIGSFDDEMERGSVSIEGENAWACQMFAINQGEKVRHS
jgi:hypothetical protein